VRDLKMINRLFNGKTKLKVFTKLHITRLL